MPECNFQNHRRSDNSADCILKFPGDLPNFHDPLFSALHAKNRRYHPCYCIRCGARFGPLVCQYNPCPEEGMSHGKPGDRRDVPRFSITPRNSPSSAACLRLVSSAVLPFAAQAYATSFVPVLPQTPSRRADAPCAYTAAEHSPPTPTLPPPETAPTHP